MSKQFQGDAVSIPMRDVLEGTGLKALPPDTALTSAEGEGIGRKSVPSSIHRVTSSPGQTSNPFHYDLIDFRNAHYVQCTDSHAPLDERLLNPTEHCHPKYMVLECGCGRRAVVSGCGKKNCTFCEKHNNLKRADRVMSHIIAQGKLLPNKCQYPVMNYLVFTIPPALRSRYIDRANLAKLRRKIWQLLYYYFDAEWGIEATHPVSEKNPDVFHPHLNFLFCIKHKSPTYLDIATIKAYYKHFLSWDKEVDIWASYTRKPGKLWHLCNYITRAFPQFSIWQGAVTYYGHPPKVEKKGARICPKCNQLILAIGHLCVEGVRMFLESERNGNHDPPHIEDYYIDFLPNFKP